MSLVYHSVTRAQYLFGHGRPPGGVAQAYGAKTSANSIAGLAIAADSEVRGVYATLPSGRRVAVVEGAPVALDQLEAGGHLELERLDYTDGRLVLMVAEKTADVPLLVSPVLPYAVVRLAGEAVDAGHAVHMQRPRGAQMWELTHGGYAFHSSTGLVERDRRWLVNGLLAPTSGLDSTDSGDEFGDATSAGLRTEVATINTAADVVVTRIGAAGTLSLALRWAEMGAASGGGGEAVMRAWSGEADMDFSYLDGVKMPGTILAPWTFVQDEDGAEGVGVVTMTVQFQNAFKAAAGYAQMIATLASLPFPPDAEYVYATSGGLENATLAGPAYIGGDGLTISFNTTNPDSNVTGAVMFQYRTGAA